MATVYHRYVRRGETPPEEPKANKRRDEANTKLLEAKTRKERALADLREGEAKRRSGELIEKSVALRQASFLLVSLRQRLLAIPAQVAHKVGEPDAHRVLMIVDEAVRAALNELADFPNTVTTNGQYAENGGETRKATEKRPEKRKTPAKAAQGSPR